MKKTKLVDALLAFAFLVFFPISGCSLDSFTPDLMDIDINEILGIDCRSSSECEKGMICVQNKCRLFCSNIIACPEGLWCDYSSDSCVAQEDIGPDGLEYYIGMSCEGTDDCPPGTLCALMPGGMICTVTCTSDARCAELLPDGCCLRLEDEYFCAPSGICGLDSDGDWDQADIDEAETEESEGQEDGSCQANERKCLDSATVARCGNDGRWLVHRHCSDQTFCHNGDCVSGPICDTDGLCCPGTFRCHLDFVQICSNDGDRWISYEQCPDNEICVDGFCYLPPQADGDQDQAEQAVDGDIEQEAPENFCLPEEGCMADDEYCFLYHPEDESGECLRYCDLPGGHCPRGYQCDEHNSVCVSIEGYCIGDIDCSEDEFCYRRPGQEDGLCQKHCFQMGESCPPNYYCEDYPGSVNYGLCVPLECEFCNADWECGSGYYCNIPIGQVDGCCVYRCGIDHPCPGPLQCCDNGRCELSCGSETCTEICDSCHVCDPASNACVPDTSLCYPNLCFNADAEGCCEECPGCINPIVCGIFEMCCPGYYCSPIEYGVYGFCI